MKILQNCCQDREVPAAAALFLHSAAENWPNSESNNMQSLFMLLYCSILFLVIYWGMQIINKLVSKTCTTQWSKCYTVKIGQEQERAFIKLTYRFHRLLHGMWHFPATNTDILFSGTLRITPGRASELFWATCQWRQLSTTDTAHKHQTDLGLQPLGLLH